MSDLSKQLKDAYNRQTTHEDLLSLDVPLALGVLLGSGFPAAAAAFIKVAERAYPGHSAVAQLKAGLGLNG